MTHQKHSDNETKETNSAAEDLDDEDLDEEHRVGRVRDGDAGAHLGQCGGGGGGCGPLGQVVHHGARGR